MSNRTKRNIFFILSAIVLIALLCIILIHTYQLWKFEGTKFGEENYTYFELLLSMQKGSIIITVALTALPFLIALHYHRKNNV